MKYIYMGWKEAGDIVAPEESRLSNFSGQTFGIDSTFWFERYYHGVVKNQFSSQTMKISGRYNFSQALSLLISLPDLLRHDITPVFYFDPMNTNEYERADASTPFLENLPTHFNYDKQFQYLQRPTELLLKYLDISYSEAPQYAEADASIDARDGKIDVVVSRDYDTLLFSAPTILRKIYDNPWEKISLRKTLERNNLTMPQLIDVAILTGTQLVCGPYDSHIEEAIEEVKTADSPESLKSSWNEYLRHSTGRIQTDAPTFKQLRQTYTSPPVNPESTEISPTNPDLDVARNFLSRGLSLSDTHIDDLLSPIAEAI